MESKLTSTLFFFLFIIFGCGPKITTKIFKVHNSLNSTQKVALLDTHHKVPENSILIGRQNFGDTGLSTSCGFKKNCSRAILEARKNGANIVKIANHKKPDLLSSCHRIEFELYYTEINVESLAQLTL